MSKSKVKWGIIAAGSIANAFAHSIKYSENSELKSVLGRNEEKVNAFAGCSKAKYILPINICPLEESLSSFF